MTWKSVAFAALGLLCSTGVALAQGTAGAEPSNGGGVIARSTTGAGAGIVNGWNYFHATNCQYYFDGATNWLTVFSPEGLFFYTPNNGIGANTFLTGCVNGNWVGVFVINAATGAFNYIYTYNFR
jgi:hypothetical protein